MKLRAILLKPTYEKTIDTSEHIIEENKVIHTMDLYECLVNIDIILWLYKCFLLLFFMSNISITDLFPSSLPYFLKRSFTLVLIWGFVKDNKKVRKKERKHVLDQENDQEKKKVLRFKIINQFYFQLLIIVSVIC